MLKLSSWWLIGVSVAAAGLWGGRAAAAPAAREVLVVESGKGTTAIVLGEKATSCAQFAALELQTHLEKITGEKVPIAREPAVPAVPVRIAVGDTLLGKRAGFPVDRLAPWEFLVAEKSGTIVLAGGDDPATTEATPDSVHLAFNGKPNGTCRAVYEFLEEYCGVHWYLPSEAGMVFPQTKRLAVRLGAPIRRRSDFRSTSFYPYQVNGEMFCPPETPELADAPESDMEKWRRNLWTIPVTTGDMLPVREVQRWLLRNKVGGVPYGPNHSFGDWLERFGRDKPEWFNYKSRERAEEILAKGKTEAFNEFHRSGEPCLTAPGAFEQVLADGRASLDAQRGTRGPAHPGDARFFSIVPNDNYVWCQCPTCKPLYDKPVVDCPLWGGASGRASSYVWDFVNRAAREVRKTHPEGWVGGIAYHDYMPPPKGFTLEPNVGVTICTYLGNWTPALRDTAYGLIRAWREDAKCRWIGLWEYFCYSAMSQYQPMFPKVCPKLLGEDVKRLHKLGVVAEFIETEDIYRFKDAPDRGWAVWSNPIWLYLNVWIRFKMWDDTSRDVGRLLSDHYRLFYGPAAKPIQGFFERIEARVTDPSLRGPKTFNDLGSNRQMADFEYLFPPEVMKELRGFVDQATALAAEEPYKTRVGWVRMGFLEPQEKALARHLAQAKRTSAHRPREAVCYRLKAAPKVDGDASDAAWEGAPPSYLGEWRTAAKPKAATWFRAGYDDRFLYLVARCDDPDAAKIRAACKERDSDVYQDDCVEVHLALDRERSRRIQILVNSVGTVQDIAYQQNETGVDVTDRSWTCEGLLAAAKPDAKGYTVELAIPWSQIGGEPKVGRALYGNICREKYSGGEGGAPAELQAWSATQGGFNEGRYFGKILLAEEDGWSLYLNEQTPAPAPALLKVDKENPWKVAPNAIRAVGDQDRVRFEMKCPKVDEKGRTYAGFSVKLDPPVDAARHPAMEIAFRKPHRDVMLEAIYHYEAADGKEYSNYFVFSPWGEASPASQTWSRAFAEGWEREKPAPKRLKSITVYGVVEGGKTPLECDYSLHWLRVTGNPMQGREP